MKRAVSLILFIFVLSFSLYLRLFPAYFPQLKKAAAFQAESELSHDAQIKIEKEYVSYSPLIKKKIFKALLAKEYKSKKAIEKKVDSEYAKLKGRFQNENGQTYLLELDPYCWMRFTRLLLKNGYPGNKKIGKNIYDTFMLAPVGMKISPHRFLYYASTFMYKVYNKISKLPLERFLFYLPVFLSAVFLSLLYFFCRRFFSYITAFFAVLFCGVADVVLRRSSAGWFDTDVLNLIFPLLIIWLLAEALPKKPKANIFYSLTASFFLGLFAFTWVGWWFVYLVVFSYFGYVFLNDLSLPAQERVNYPPRFKNLGISFAVFLGGSILFSLLIAQFNPLTEAYRSILANLGLGKALGHSIWPSTYYTVGELRRGGFKEIANGVNGIGILFLSFLFSFWMYIKHRRSKRQPIVIMLLFWMFFMLYASFKSIRFSMFLAVPLAIFFGWGVEQGLKVIYAYYQKVNKLKFEIPLFSLLAAIIFLAVFPIATRGIKSAQGIYPLMDDAWHDILVKIKKSTPAEAIINSWWDFGDWFKEIARRRVIFDGQSQNRPLAYWMGRVFLSSDERETINILRMLNNSSDTLFDEVSRWVKDDFRTIALLSDLVKSDKEKAQAILSGYNLPKEVKKKIIETIFTHNPGAAYFIVDKSMISKMSSISFLGSWDFAKVYVSKNRNSPQQDVLKYIEDNFMLDKKEALAKYNEVMFAGKDNINEVVSRRQGFSFVSSGKEEEGIVYFENGTVFNTKELSAKIFFPYLKQYKNPAFIYFYDEGKGLVNYKGNNNSALKTGCIFIKDKQGSWKAVGTSKALISSFFNKLYFFKALGLKHFTPFISDKKKGIYVYRIKWQ